MNGRMDGQTNEHPIHTDWINIYLPQIASACAQPGLFSQRVAGPGGWGSAQQKESGWVEWRNFQQLPRFINVAHC